MNYPTRTQLLLKYGQCTVFLLLISVTHLQAQTAFTLRSGVVAYWSFDDSFNADLGEEAFNLTKSGTGTAGGPVISGSDATFHAAANFTRSFSDYLKTALSSNVNTDDADFTYYARYMPTAAIGLGNRYFVMESALNEHAISFGLRNDGQSSNVPRSEVYAKNSSGTPFFHEPNAGGNFGVAVNTWQNILVVYTKVDKTYRIYINGVQASGTLTHTGIIKGAGLVIGSFRDTNGRFWEGAIDEVAVWNRTLSSLEIAAMQNTQIKIPLQKATIASTQATAISFNISSGENLTAYYKVIPAASTCPTAQLLKTDINSIALPLNTTSATPGISGLTPSTGYKICHVAMDAANRLGAVLETSFTTSAALPLTWKSFTARAQNNDVALKWETFNEQNTESFLIQHSNNGADFITIGNVPAAGNSTETHSYQFVHRDAGSGIHFYRLQQIDIDHRASYSNIVNAVIGSSVPAISLLSNPVKNKQVQVRSTEKGAAWLFDSNGKLMVKQQIIQGINLIEVKQCPPGTYMLRINESLLKIVLE